MRLLFISGQILIVMLMVNSVQALPTVPGFVVEGYADVTDPIGLSFAPSGDLYVGRDNFHSGGGYVDPVKIHKVAAGGAPVQEYGVQAIPDPDAVLFDELGGPSGVAGSVLVGGVNTYGVDGMISAIAPDQTVSVLLGPLAAMMNPQSMVFDQNGRLLVANGEGAAGQTHIGVANIGNNTFDPLINVAGTYPYDLAIDATNRVSSSWEDGNIRIHNPDGSLVDDDFLTGLGRGAIVFGPGGLSWGTDLYALRRSTGELLRIDTLGSATVIGTGFTPDQDHDMTFGADKALYVSDASNDKILRIIPESAPQSWRSVRYHSGPVSADLSIVLDASASGLAVVSETRRADVDLKVVVDMTATGALGVIATIEAEDMSTHATYAATPTVIDNGGGNYTLELLWAGGLPDEACYNIDLTGKLNYAVPGDADCMVKVLVGNTNGDNNTDLIDMAQTKSKNGTSVAGDDVRFDVNLDGHIDLIDMAMVKSLNGNATSCP